MIKKPPHKKVALLELEEYTQPSYDKSFRWAEKRRIWTHFEWQSRRNIFSTIGISAQSALFTLHPTELTPYNLLQYDDNYFFITRVDKLSPVKMEVETAKVHITHCKTYLIDTDTDPMTKRVKETRSTVYFPAILTEKYLGYEQQEPMAIAPKTYALIAPKQIFIEPSDLVELSDGHYIVRTARTLDQYKNEYEIYREEEL